MRPREYASAFAASCSPTGWGSPNSWERDPPPLPPATSAISADSRPRPPEPRVPGEPVEVELRPARREPPEPGEEPLHRAVHRVEGVEPPLPGVAPRHLHAEGRGRRPDGRPHLALDPRRQGDCRAELAHLLPAPVAASEPCVRPFRRRLPLSGNPGLLSLNLQIKPRRDMSPAMRLSCPYPSNRLIQ